MGSLAGYAGTAGAIVAILLSIWTVFRARRVDTRGDIADIAEKKAREVAGDLVLRVGILEVKMDLYWQGVARTTVALLHSPHRRHARRDWLLENLKDLLRTEQIELAQLLEKILADENSPPVECLAAAQLLGFMAARWPQMPTITAVQLEPGGPPRPDS